MGPGGLRGRTEEQIMLNQARYFLPGMTSDNCQKITSWNFNIYTMWNGNGARFRHSHVDSQSVDKEEENRAEWKREEAPLFLAISAGHQRALPDVPSTGGSRKDRWHAIYFGTHRSWMPSAATILLMARSSSRETASWRSEEPMFRPARCRALTWLA